MSQILELKNWYLSNFETFEHNLNGEKSQYIHNIRKDAISKFSELEFPTTHDEDWKYTNIAPLLKFKFNSPENNLAITESQIRHLLFDGENFNLLVFLNGHFSKSLSKTKMLPAGAIAGNISESLKNNSQILYKHFSRYANYNEQIFTALSTAFAKDGAFVYIPEDKVMENPLHILFLTVPEEDNIISQPRNLIVAGKNSSVSVIEHYVSLNGGVYFTNAVSEVYADENSSIDHIKLQEESVNSFHISRMEVLQEANSRFTSHAFSTGGKISRNDINTKLNSSGAESILNGLFLIGGEQLYDTHTLIDHSKSYCNSHEHYKGILTDNSRGVFNGKVIVRPDAQKTNAFQENNNIILSNDALVNTKPQLEIFADDVKCSHGATIGRLDEDAMFYLKSRGIGEEKSRIILLHAFASDIVKTVKVKAIKDYLENLLDNRFRQD